MNIPMLVGNLIALIGLIAAIYYLIMTQGYARVAPPPDGVSEYFVHIIRRRRFGASLMILIAVMFFIAANWYMDIKTPDMSIFWLLLLLMLFWLLILAAMDIRAVRKLRQKVMHRDFNRFKTTIDEFKDKASKDTDSSEKKNDNDDTDHSS